MSVATKSRRDAYTPGDVTPKGLAPMLAHRITNRDPKTGRVLFTHTGEVCDVLGCVEAVACRQWCRDHYKRWWRTGSPEGRETPHFWARFWDKVEFTESCWLWTAGKTKGYGSVGVNRGLSWYAHRLAYEFIIGPIPAGLEIDHLCRTPACVRPDHLEPVTHQVNGQRAGVYARWTHCKRGHPLSGNNLISNRRCRECTRRRSLEYYYRAKARR